MNNSEEMARQAQSAAAKVAAKHARIEAMGPRKVKLNHGYFVLIREVKAGFEAALYTRQFETIAFGLCKTQEDLDSFLSISEHAVESVY